MKDQIEFEMLLEDVLRGVANPEPTEGLEQRVLRQIDVAQLAGASVLTMSTQEKELQSHVNLFAAETKDQGILSSLWSSLRDLLFPAKLPPLVLESRPIAVVDRMAGASNYPSTGYAVAAHALVILLIGFVVNAQIRKEPPTRTSVTAIIDPPVALQVAQKADRIGGGGGQQGVTPVTRGRLPKLEQEQLVAPKVPLMQTVMLEVQPSVVVQPDVKMAENKLPDIGMPNSPLVGASLGAGRGTGIGSGDGDGIGPGSGGNIGGGIRLHGGGVTPPKILYQPDPEFSEEARKAKISGSVHVYLQVDEHGNPTHVRVIRGIGMGLDEKAVESVKQYKFKPAMENGKPVTVEMYVDVIFTIL